MEKVCHHGFNLARFASAPWQLKLMGFIFLCGPGMFAGLTGLGGAGLGNPTPINNSLIANYAASAVVGFFAGPITTRLGFRLSLMVGAAAFTFYSACLLLYKHTQMGWILIVGGTILGILSTLEWTAQGTMMMTYPLPKEKGKHASFNLTMFNLGAALGSLIVLLQNLHTGSANVNNGTYVGFIVVMSTAVLTSALIVPVKVVSRRDGSKVTLPDTPTWTGVIKGLLKRLRSDPHITALFPMMFVSKFLLPYIYNDINLATFNIRTRALNILLFYMAGIAGAYATGYTLDTKRLRRTVRVKIGLLMLVAAFTSIFAGAFSWQHAITRRETQSSAFRLIDCTDKAYVKPLFLFLAFGFVHFVFQTCIYYFMTALADTSATASLADYAGFFRSLQAVGLAVAWRLSNLELPFMTDLAISWGLTIASILFAAPMLIWKVQDFEVALEDDEEFIELTTGCNKSRHPRAIVSSTPSIRANAKMSLAGFSKISSNGQ